jgi:hypothetical protein
MHSFAVFLRGGKETHVAGFFEREKLPSMNERLKISKKDLAMKITREQIFLTICLFFLLCLPAIVFICLCVGIFLAFGVVLLAIAQNGPLVIGGAWLSLLIFYIVFGVAFTRFVARLLHAYFGAEERRVQRRMAFLSGSPFYALCLLCLVATIVCFLFPDMVSGLTAFASELGFVGFGLVSCSYLLLLRFFSLRYPQTDRNKGALHTYS